ncbi:hypothetical protein BI343_02320 [Chromobacterium amazonense]|nr:hypothetical protein BI343_02320 [Chromobacterium amazonense]
MTHFLTAFFCGLRTTLAGQLHILVSLLLPGLRLLLGALRLHSLFLALRSCGPRLILTAQPCLLASPPASFAFLQGFLTLCLLALMLLIYRVQRIGCRRLRPRQLLLGIRWQVGCKTIPPSMARTTFQSRCGKRFQPVCHLAQA